jgi:CheY-like chemotaxis protein
MITHEFTPASKPVEILLVEDEPGDVRLMIEAMRQAKVRNTLRVVEDGQEALDYLFRRPPFENAPRPDLILLDLNLPRRDGHEVLKTIKADALLRSIPVVILTTSEADTDIARCYNQHASCYITKPVDLNQFLQVIKSIENFWLTIVRLPPHE